MCHFRHTWISNDGEDIYIWKLEKDKQISPDWFFKYDRNMPGYLQEVGSKIAGNKCVHSWFQEF